MLQRRRPDARPPHTTRPTGTLDTYVTTGPSARHALAALGLTPPAFRAPPAHTGKLEHPYELSAPVIAPTTVRFPFDRRTVLERKQPDQTLQGHDAGPPYAQQLSRF